MAQIKQQGNFTREIRRLRALYNATLFAFPDKGKEIHSLIYSGEIDPQDKVYLNNNVDEKYYLAGNSYEFADKLKTGYIKTLKEVTFIRAISALEVLLIDLMKQIFLSKKYLFHSGQKIEFSQSELLSSQSISTIWSKIINKECRNLQNQGFKEISKYYRNTFSIDFNQSPVSITEIQYFHDIRHLLVHRLGKTDIQFRHNHNTSKKEVQISENQFYDSLEKIQSFGTYVSDKVIELIESPESHKASNLSDMTCNLSIKINPEKIDKIFSSDFSFLSEEEVYILRDLLQSFEIKEDEMKLFLVGKQKVIRDYLKLVKASEKNGNIIIETLDKHVSVSISEDEMDLVKSLLLKTKKGEISMEDIPTISGFRSRKVRKIIDQINRSENEKEID